MRIEALWPLWLLIALPLTWWLAWRHRSLHARGRLGAACLLRSLALGLVVLALMRPAVLHRVDAVSVVYALDVSHSVRARDIDTALRWIDAVNARQRPAAMRIVAFADRARILETTTQARNLALASGNARQTQNIDPSASDLEQALRTALYAFSAAHAKRLVLITDASQTRGDAWRALPALRAAGVRVYALPVSPAGIPDAWIETIELPARLRAHEPTETTLRVFARGPMRARVSLTVADAVPLTRDVTLDAGSNALRVELRIPRTGATTLTARVDAEGDEIADNDTLRVGAWVERPVRALLVEGGSTSAPYLTDALRAHGIDVRVVPPERLASSLDDADTVVLSDVPPEAVQGRTGELLERFVRDAGGGLVFAAGDNTYGKDGFAGGAVERVLPITFEARRKRRELDLVLLIDRSYSMRGRKLELAKAAAIGTLDLLQPEHRLGVIAFDAKPHEVVPLAAVGNKRRAEDLILGMTASGQTNVYTALLQARRMLSGSTAQTRHVILLSDGVTASAPLSAGTSNSERAQETIRRVREGQGQVLPFASETNEQPGLEGFAEFARELADEGITLSTVAIGDRPNLPLLSTLAEMAKGKHYVARSDSEIPGLFVAEAKRLLGESVVETTFQAQPRMSSPLTASVDFRRSPPLHGYVVARAKGIADVILTATQDKPLLVSTQYGLGHTVAFTSDVKNRWSAQWLTWPGYGRLWAQIVRGVARPAFEPLSWRVERHQDEAWIALEARDASGHRTTLSPRVRVRLPDGAERMLALRQTGAGEYRASLPIAVARNQPYRFEVVEGGGINASDAQRLGARVLYFAHSDEYRVRAPDTALLTSLVTQTGGRPGATPEEIFDPRQDGGRIPHPLWPYLLAVTLLLFIAEIAVRRLPWPPVRRAVLRETSAGS